MIDREYNNYILQQVKDILVSANSYACPEERIHQYEKFLCDNLIDIHDHSPELLQLLKDIPCSSEFMYEYITNDLVARMYDRISEHINYMNYFGEVQRL